MERFVEKILSIRDNVCRENEKKLYVLLMYFFK